MDVAVSNEVGNVRELLEAARAIVKSEKDDPMMQEELLAGLLRLSQYLPFYHGMKFHEYVEDYRQGRIPSPERRAVQQIFFKMVDDWNSLILKELGSDIAQRPRVSRAVNIIMTLIETADESAFEPMREGDNG